MPNVVPLPLRAPLFDAPAGRPGDWWEPVSIAAEEVAMRLGTDACRRRLPVDIVAALLVEHALVVRDIGECGLDADRSRAALTAAGDAPLATGPGRLHTSYVRMLRGGQRDYEPASDAQVTARDLVVPLRLHDATRDLELPELFSGDLLDEALDWEVASATCGQFMREWALRILLAESALPQPI